MVAVAARVVAGAKAGVVAFRDKVAEAGAMVRVAVVARAVAGVKAGAEAKAADEVKAALRTSPAASGVRLAIRAPRSARCGTYRTDRPLGTSAAAGR
jgi:hypothetical protein